MRLVYPQPETLPRQAVPAVIRVRPETPSRITEFSEHEANGCEAQEGERTVVEIFPILGKPSTAVEPADRSLDNPTLWQNNETLGSVTTTHDLGYQARHGKRQTVLKHRPGIRGVGKQFLEKREPREQRRQDQQPTIAILHIGRGHQSVQQEPYRVDEDMAFLALDQLAGIEPMWIDTAPPFSALFTLWLSMMQAVGLASRSACSRHLT
jgi:hypothetical protein